MLMCISNSYSTQNLEEFKSRKKGRHQSKYIGYFIAALILIGIVLGLGLGFGLESTQVSFHYSYLSILYKLYQSSLLSIEVKMWIMGKLKILLEGIMYCIYICT